MAATVRVTDETTEAEIFEAIGHVARTPWTVEREARLDALLDEVLERRGRG